MRTVFLLSSLFGQSSTHARGGVRHASSVARLCREIGILAPEETREPPLASAKDLRLFHDESYVESLLEGRTDHDSEDVKLARTVAGGSLLGAKMIAENQADAVFFPAGGDTHAVSDGPSDTDLFNDSALAVSLLESLGMRVAFINVSARHADAVQAAFYENGDVLTVSIHEASRDNLPSSGFVGEDGLGEGKGSALNVPLSEGLFDEAAIEILSDLVIPFVRRKQPDAIVAVLSPDILASDATTTFALTNNVLVEAVRAILNLHRPLLLLGGDGNDKQNTVRAWALLWAALTKRVSLANANSPIPLVEHRAFVPPEQRLAVGRDMKPVLDALRRRLYGRRLPTRRDLKALEELDQE